MIKRTHQPALAAVALIAALVLPRVHPLIVTYTPPPYIGGAPEEYEDPESVQGIEGGTVDIHGRGDLQNVVATLGSDTLLTQPDNTGWIITLLMPSESAAAHVEDGMEERFIKLEPVRDSLPVVTLLEPARDTVVPSAGGRIHLVAQVSDDHGVAEAYFEYDGARTGRLGGWAVRRLSGSTGPLTADLNLDSLKLRPGDVLHLRAVARDFRPGARGVGTSETRSYSVIRTP